MRWLAPEPAARLGPPGKAFGIALSLALVEPAGDGGEDDVCGSERDIWNLQEKQRTERNASDSYAQTTRFTASLLCFAALS
jgi:hypothetical protein